jgi:23S rRNA (adenine2503-C2)-methyltransferase
MATALDIAKRNSNAAPLTVSDAARAAGLDTLAIEKKAELSVVPGMALGGTTLVGLTRDQLKDRLGEIGVPERERKMRAAQLWHWIYLRGDKDFTEMSIVG